ncbi:pyridoxal kinase PdxY [Agarivorans sp. 1_MG-2023]|uniref:pyridoxal kinase PdxY n=1 Tax=Agarivorans sp. 1_MG-2023 TaxID=3062634 RepID=UPI0026E2DBAD|nr:pyridoxal kinase PdxY [Agarivorans sp. 1_MG-2023]MDO6762140.1 pyridoxal kinase PdxY [Agarivorans sp. 1_MG-2023]
MKGIISIQSHVVFGHAGNSSAVFPLQRMGFEVWPVHTVQFSNHTQYSQGWTGQSLNANQVTDLISGIDAIGQLTHCQAVLSGYLGSAEQAASLVDIVNRVKRVNPKAIYICDPVMGDPEKGCMLAEGVSEYLVAEVMPKADVIVPNQFELSHFVKQEIHNVDDAVIACQKALSLGPKVVLVKHLHSVSEMQFSMMLADASGCYLVTRPKLDFAKAPVGVGDLISALFTGGLLKGWPPIMALEYANNASYGVLQATQQSGEWELQTILAQDQFELPSSHYSASKVA